MRRTLVLFTLSSVLLACGSVAPTAAVRTSPSDPAVRIELYERKLAEHPDLFAGHAALGAAYLDKARESHDVAWIAKARAALERSLEIQPSLNALVSMASLCSFSHRFECALELADRAARANPTDARLRSIRVEAQLGLGRTDAVAALLEAATPAPDDALLRAARGRWLAELERFDEARAAVVEAAALARAAQATDLAIWAETNAAGMLLDSDRAEPALQHLEAAAALPRGSRPVQSALAIHWAEYHALRGEGERALEIYAGLLGDPVDPEIARRAFVLAQQLGQRERAAELFRRAQSEAERIRAAGEVYALEAQARLYADAGLELERAEALAQQNLEWKRDRSARETLDYVRARRAGAVAPGL